MTNELRQAIEQITEAAPRLNRATEEAARLVKMVDDFLAEQAVGLPVQVLVEPGRVAKIDEDELADRKELPYRAEWLYLSYKRCSDGKFHIAVERELCASRHPDINEELTAATTVSNDVVLWSSASRSDKLKTFARLPALVAEIARQLTDAVDGTTEATKAIEQLSKTMQSRSLSFAVAPPVPRSAAADDAQSLDAMESTIDMFKRS